MFKQINNLYSQVNQVFGQIIKNNLINLKVHFKLKNHHIILKEYKNKTQKNKLLINRINLLN